MIQTEIDRCLKCKNPRCKAACPAATPINEVMTLLKNGERGAAGKMLFENNPLSSICSVVCPHERNCYGHCVLGIKSEPVKFYLVEQEISGEYIKGFKPDRIAKNDRMIAVVGAGPAGIAVSLLLAQRGFDVTLMDSRPQIGGVLRYGIPEFRLPKEKVDVYGDVLRRMGVRFKPNTFVGSTLMLDDMFLDGYDAVFLAIGTAKPNRLGLLGETLGNVHYAIDFLRNPEAYDLGGSVAVIGAGNVAMDAARMAVRQNGVKKVTVLNNRGAEDMTADKNEIRAAEDEGICFVHLKQTLRVTTEGVLTASVTRTISGEGRPVFEENITDRGFVAADTVIIAIGQGPQGAATQNSSVSKTQRGLIDADSDGVTAMKGVFAAGDIVTGPQTVVEAMAFAKRAAGKIEEYCGSLPPHSAQSKD